MAFLMGDSGFQCLQMCLFVAGSGGRTRSDTREGDHEKRGILVDEGAELSLTCQASKKIRGCHEWKGTRKARSMGGETKKN